MMTYTLTQKYFALRSFTASGTLKELAEIITAGEGEIAHLEYDHTESGSFSEIPPGYASPGWYYRLPGRDEYTEVWTLEQAIRQFGQHDTSYFSLTKHEQTI